MTVKSATAWSGIIVCKDSTGALATPSVGPVGALYVDGTANGASVTISGSNPYKWTVTLPTLTAGQIVSMYITATIATIATASVVAEDVADTAYGSEALRPTTAGRTLDVSATGEAGLDFDNVKAATAPTTLTNVTVPVVTTLTNMPAAAPSAETIAAEILVTPANKLATGAAGVVTPSGGSVGSVTSGVTLADDAITSAKFDEITAFPVKFADTGSTKIARVGADSDTLETLSDQLDVLGASATTYSYSNTVDDGSGNLLDGVFVELATDNGMTNIVYTTHTNSLGAYTVYDDIAGTHYIRYQLGGFSSAIVTVTLA